MTRDEILAMEAGTKLDMLVARMMGLRPVGLPAFSIDITAAWMVVDHLYDEGWIISIGSLAQEPRGWRCELCNMWGNEFERCPSNIEANGDTAPLAICRAALLAFVEDDND